MLELTTYSIQDFIPYTKEIYFSLFNRPGALSLFSILGLIGSLVLVVSVVLKRWAIASLALAILWPLLGYYFFAHTYSQISWMAPNFAYLSYLMGALFLLLALFNLKNQKDYHKVSLLLFGLALIASPLLIYTQVSDPQFIPFPGHSSEGLILMSLGLLFQMKGRWPLFVVGLPLVPFIVYGVMRFISFFF